MKIDPIINEHYSPEEASKNLLLVLVRRLLLSYAHMLCHVWHCVDHAWPHGFVKDLVQWSFLSFVELHFQMLSCIFSSCGKLELNSIFSQKISAVVHCNGSSVSEIMKLRMMMLGSDQDKEMKLRGVICSSFLVRELSEREIINGLKS